MRKVLKPHKFLNLDNSVINISCLIIKNLMANGIMTYNDLYDSIYKLNGENMKSVFMPSINFLFLLGKIRYHKESDTLELIL